MESIPATNADRKSPWKLLATLLLIALAVRGGVLWGQFKKLRSDPDAYAALAEGLVREGIYGRVTSFRWARFESTMTPTAFRPPVYPLVLASLVRDDQVSRWQVALLHLGLGVATALLTFQLARMWQLPASVAMVAGLLVAFDPILLQQSTLVMTETLATFLAVVALVALTRFSKHPAPFDAALAGGAIALSALCRPTFYVWLAMCVGVAVWLGASNWRRTLNVIAFMLATALVVSPWAVRNWLSLGRPILATTHGGYTLALGNNSGFYQCLLQGRSGEARAEDMLSSYELYLAMNSNDELAIDRYYSDVAWGAIQREPFMFVWACAHRIAWLWWPLPQRIDPDESTTTMLLRYAVAVWYVFVFALAIIGIATLRGRLSRTPWLWGVLLCIAFTAVHTVYWTNLRMRAPLMPVVALVAALGVEALWRRFRPAQAVAPQ